MSNGRLVFPGPRGIVLLRADGRLLLLPARAAAGSRGRRGCPRLLPALPGRPIAVGFEGRWIRVQTWRDGESLLVRIPPKSDEIEILSLGEVPEPTGLGLSPLPEVPVDWPRPATVPTAGDRVLKLGGSEPLLAFEPATGQWVVCSRREAVEVSVQHERHVVSPARLGRELGLATLAERELSFLGSAGSTRRTILDVHAVDFAPCEGAPWLALFSKEQVSLRDLGSRWGRRLGQWRLPA